MTSVSQSGGGSSPKSATFEYNLAGQLQYLKRYDSSSLVADSVYRYDGAGRLRSITHSEIPIDRTQSWNGTSNSSTVIAAYFLKYDQADRIVGFSSFADAFEATYAYDNRDQLVSASYSPIAGLTSVVPSLPTVENYSFDATGNRTNNGADSASGTHNRLQSDGTYTYQYDNEGNQTSRTEIATGTVTQYTYDHRNRLTKVVAPGKTVLYQYDAQDRRIGKQIDENSNGSIEEVTFWVWDGNQVVLQFKDHDGSGSQPYQLTNRYLYGDIVDLLLADEQVGVENDPYGSSSPYGSSNPISSGSIANRILWPLADHLNSIRDVVDSEQRRREHKVYDTFGRTLSETDFDMYGTELPAGDPAEVDTLFGYTGREWDDDIGLQYNRARWYDPAQGRWLSQDPIGFNAGDANLYRYIGNSPTNATDPSGLAGEGHHWVPVSVAWTLYEEGRISLAQLKLFGGRTSGPLVGGHTWSAEHAEYNDEVETTLRDWVKSKAKNKATPDEVISRIRDGMNHDGTPNKILKKFNNDIKKHMLCVPGENTYDGGALDEKKSRGVKSLQKRNIIMPLLGSILATWAKTTDAAEGVRIVRDAEGMQYATQLAREGRLDFDILRRALIGELGDLPNAKTSVYAELRNHNVAVALSFRAVIEFALNDLERRLNQLQSDVNNVGNDEAFCRPQTSLWGNW